MTTKIIETYNSQIARLEDERKTLVNEMQDLTENELGKGPQASWDAGKDAMFKSKRDVVDSIDAQVRSLVTERENVSQTIPVVATADDDFNANYRALDAFVRDGIDAMDSDARDAFMSADGGFKMLTNPATSNQPSGVTGVDTGTDPVFTLEDAKGIAEITDSFASPNNDQFLYPSIDSAGDTPAHAADYRANDLATPTSFPGNRAADLELLEANFIQDVQFPQVPELTSKVVPIRETYLEDARVPLETIVNQQIVRRLGYKVASDMTNGSTADQIRGFAGNTSQGALESGATPRDLTFQNIVELMHSVPRAYMTGEQFMGGRNALGGRTAFVGSYQTLRQIRLLEDSQKRPLMLPHDEGLMDGFGGMLLGIPFVIDDYLPTPDDTTGWTTTGTENVLWFGNFGYMKRRVGGGIRLKRYDDSNYSARGFVGFEAVMRMDARLVGGGAITNRQVTACDAIKHLTITVS